MNDLERLLERSLKSVGEAYAPTDASAAKERFFRRRRRRRFQIYGGAVAAAGAAAAIVLLVSPTNEIGRERPERVTPVVGPKEAVVETTIRVGVLPSGVGAGDGFVYVANPGSGTLAVVDPAQGEVVRKLAIRGRPDDVVSGYGYAWVTSFDGRLTRVQSNTLTKTDLGIMGSGGHLDIAAGIGDIWLIESGKALYRVDAVTGRIEDRFAAGRNPSDVAVLDDVVWVYERAAGEVLRIDPDSGKILGREFVGYSESADLRAADGYTWFYSGAEGTLFQLDASDGRVVSKIELGGTYGAIAAEGDQLWAMVADSRTGKGTLFQIDAERAIQIRNPIPLTDSPVDLLVAYGSVWITNGDTGSVTRVGVVSDRAQLADPNEDVLFYYASAGDIFSYRSDGASVPVVSSPAEERAPSLSPERVHLAFERADSAGGAPDVVVFDLQRGDERVVMRGESPALGPDGLVAGITSAQGSANVVVDIRSLHEGGAMGFGPATAATAGPALPHDLTWDAVANTMYLTINDGQTALYRLGIPTDLLEGGETRQDDIVPSQQDAAYVAPVGDGTGGVAVVKLCCDSPGGNDYESAELVVIDSSGEHRIVGLDDLGLDPAAQIFLADADGLTYDVTTGWQRRDRDSWFVGDGFELWLVYEDGRRPDAIELPEVTGVAVIPD